MSLLNQLNRIFRDVFNDDQIEIRAETTEQDIGAWDSLSEVNLIMRIEEHFHIRFTPKEMTSFKSVGDLIGMIEMKTSRT